MNGSEEKENREMSVPPGFEAAFQRVILLEELSQQNPLLMPSLIELCTQMLDLLSPDEFPIFYSTIQSILGNAYSDLLIGDRATNLKRAIGCYQEALRFWTPQAAPLDYARVQGNLGATYNKLPTGDPTADLKRAIEYYEQALRFLRPQAVPLEYATTQMNLGTAYQQIPTEDRAANLERAMACYQEALRFFTPETAPFQYAMTQNNLGNAYRDLPTGDRTANLKRAIACYQQALRLLTPQTAPVECRRINNNLANLYFDQKDYKAALGAFRVAMEAGEQLYQAGLSTTSKAAEIQENVSLYSLYHHAAFCALRCGQAVEALLMLEQGKTRLLAEALRLRIARPEGVSNEVWHAFEVAGAAIRTAQAEPGVTPDREHNPVEAYMQFQQRMRTANAALVDAIEQVRMRVPDFLRVPDLKSIQTLVSDGKTVLLTFCLTDHGSMGLIVGRQDQDITVVELPAFTRTNLRQLFAPWDDEGGTLRAWLGEYLHYRRQSDEQTFQAWQETITRTLETLGQALEPVLAVLAALPDHITHLLFLPSAELFLFPLHAVPLLSNGAKLVCDRYQVSYAPSLEVLLNIRAKAMYEGEPDLYAVINPESDPRLAFTPIEGRAIAKLFKLHHIDEERAGTIPNVVAGVREKSYVHFACHGSYDWNDPPASGLSLADGRLTLAQLQQGVVDLSRARLVTLSACETGISDVMQGSPDEYVGVPAGFLLAGVPCVVSSLWAVPDLSTALLMERFYRNHLQGGMDFAAALREAQLWIRQATARELALAELWEHIYQNLGRGDIQAQAFKQMRYYRSRPDVQPFAHPYYWAAFTVNGI